MVKLLKELNFIYIIKNYFKKNNKQKLKVNEPIIPNPFLQERKKKTVLSSNIVIVFIEYRTEKLD